MDYQYPWQRYAVWFTAIILFGSIILISAFVLLDIASLSDTDYYLVGCWRGDLVDVSGAVVPVEFEIYSSHDYGITNGLWIVYEAGRFSTTENSITFIPRGNSPFGGERTMTLALGDNSYPEIWLDGEEFFSVHCPPFPD